jgi:hypothetical protein
VRDLQQQGEQGLCSPVASLLVLRLQLRLSGCKRSAMQRLRVRTVICAPLVAVLCLLVNAASMPPWEAAVLHARHMLSLDANSDRVHVMYKSVVHVTYKSVVHVTYKSVALWPLPFRTAPRDICLLRY